MGPLRFRTFGFSGQVWTNTDHAGQYQKSPDIGGKKMENKRKNQKKSGQGRSSTGQVRKKRTSTENCRTVPDNFGKVLETDKQIRSISKDASGQTRTMPDNYVKKSEECLKIDFTT